VVNLDIPIVILRLFLNSKNDDEIHQVLKQTDDFKVFIAEELKSHFLPIIDEYLPGDTYKDFLKVKEAGEKVCIKTMETDDMITEIILLVEEEQDLIAISIKGEFNANDILIYMDAIDNSSAIDINH